MRIILSIVGIILLIVAMSFVPATRNYMLKHAAEYYLSSSTLKVRIGHLDADDKKMHAQDTSIYVNGVHLTTIEIIALDYDLNEVLKTKKLNFAVKLQDKTTLLGKDAIIDADIKYVTNSSDDAGAEVTIAHLSSEVFTDLGISALEGSCKISSGKGRYHIGDCRITDGKARLEFEAKINTSPSGLNSLLIKGNAKELPIDLHKTFHHMIAEDATMQYLYDNISGAMLREGNWEINLDEEFFASMKMKPEYIKGEFNVENVRLSYDPDFPTLEKINTKLIMKGSELNFGVSSAYTNETLLSNAKVVIDWGVEGDANVVIDADANGPAVNLTNFIPKKQLESLVESGIDLAKLKGSANSKVHLVVPIGEAKNTYEITSNISGVELSVFDGAAVMTKAILKGSFNGDVIKVDGNGLINDFMSKINFANFTDPTSEFDNVIEIKTNLIPPEQISSVRPYSISSGAAVLEFSYKNKGDKAQTFAKSNLINAEFGVDKLGIRSGLGDKAYLEVKGETAVDGTMPLSIKLTGENNLQIIGDANISKDVTKVSLSKIRAHDTNARADIEMKKKSMKVKLRGKMLDLSNSNMMQFLAKNSDDTATSLDVVLEQVKLKNNVLLDNFSLHIQCDKVRCYKGVMSSKVGTKDFNMNLISKDDYEEWKVTTSNAGAILKGVGMMENIKSGSLVMNIETRRSDVKAGQTIPIAKGDFVLEKFVTVDNKFLTRLISFTSLPGLMNFIRSNHDISFTKMDGQFNYKNDVLNIFNGSAQGPFMDLTIKGNVFTKERKMRVKGTVLPSKYGPGIVSKIPVIGQVFKMTPYSMEYGY